MAEHYTITMTDGSRRVLVHFNNWVKWKIAGWLLRIVLHFSVVAERQERSEFPEEIDV